MLRQGRTPKKKKKRFSFFGCSLLIVTMLGFVGMGAGFYYVLSGNSLKADFNPSSINIMQQIVSDATTIPATNTAITPDIAPNSQTFRDILNDLNETRVNAQLNPVRLNSQLNRAAAVQAIYNAEIGRLDHDDANGDYVDVRVSMQGYEWNNVGENLLSDWSLDGHEAFELWRNSPGHNANMMNENFTEVGLAYIVTPLGQVYHAMVLARPK